MKKHIILTLAMLMASVFVGCNENTQVLSDESNTISVITEKAETSVINEKINVSGNIEGEKTVKLGFMVAGKVEKINFDEGSQIKKDQLIASLEDESYAIAKEIAEANFDQVQDEYNRLDQMHSQNSISESDYSKVTNGLRVAKAQLRLQVKNLKDTKLYSPINGVLLKKGVEEGEIIGQGMPVFVVSDIRKVKVHASIPESDFNSIRINSEAEVYISSLEKTFIGKITEIGSLAEPTTRAFTVKVDLDNSGLLIRPGMTSEVRINNITTKKVITLPIECILKESDNSSYVYVVDREKNQAFKRIVVLGQISSSRIEIVSGINQDEEVVVGGQNKLVNGSSIK